MEQMDLFGFTTSPSRTNTTTLRTDCGRTTARTSASRESGREWQRGATRAPASPLTSCGLPESCDPGSSFGRTWRAVSIPRTPPTSSDSPLRLGTAGILSRGECWTRSMCEWTGWSVPSRRDGGVCGLSDILEPMSPALLKYFLSPTALRGILRRAESRGKALPTLLADAIAWMLEWWEKHPELLSRAAAGTPSEADA